MNVYVKQTLPVS